MKKSYSDKIVNDYIYGNDIEEYDIEQLENDPVFMMQVIDKTNDKKMYKFCSDEVKNNYEFVKFIIYKFKSDKDFIVKIADDYLKNNNKNSEEINIDCTELSIIMENILGYTNNLCFDKFIVTNKALYNRLSTELLALYEKDYETKKVRDFGLGFYYLQYIFKNRYIILDYYAKEYIEEIFYRNEKYNFEKLIHKIVRNKEEISKNNINSFIINYVSRYDSNLSWYLSCHTELMQKVRKDIKRIYDTWDSYVRCINSNKVDIFEYYVEKIFKETNIRPSFSETQLVEFVVNKMNLEDVFKDNLLYSSLRDLECFKTEDYSKDLLDSKDIDDIRVCNLALKKAHDIFVDEDLSVPDDYIKDKKEPIKTQKIKFNLNKEE